MNVKTNSQSCRVAPWQEMHVCLFIFPSIFHLHMSGGCVLTVRELMGIFVSESGVCQRCGGPAPLGAVVKPKSTILLQGETDSSGSLGDMKGVFHQTVITQL